MDIRPFRGFRPDPKVVGAVSRVLSPPFDQYDQTLQTAAYRQSPFHFVRLIHNRDEEPEKAATQTLAEWLESGVLVQENAPAIYPYLQSYRDASGKENSRYGFIALLRLTPLAGEALYPHERTLTQPLTGRLTLTRATRSDFGPVFVICPDEKGEIKSLVARCTEGKAQIDARDTDGNRHRLWIETDSAWHEAMAKTIAPLKGVLADGHCRYRAALQYAQEQTQGGSEHDPPAQFKLVAIFPMGGEGLSVRPIHRLVKSWPEEVKPERLFTIKPMPHWRPEDAVNEVARTPGTIGVFSRRGGAEIWAPKSGATFDWSGDPSAAYRKLPPVVFEAAVLRGLLGLNAEDLARQRSVSFAPHVSEARRLLWRDHERAFFLAPTPLTDVFRTAFAGELMPQKSTYFYPKVLSGMVSYLHDHT